MPRFFHELFWVLTKANLYNYENRGNLAFIGLVASFYFHRPYASICQIYIGAVSVNTKQANKIDGALQSNISCLR